MLTRIFKELIERPEIGVHQREYSFPSGNATATTAGLRRPGAAAAAVRLRRIVSIAGAVVLPLYGVALVLLLWHYPSDVVAGWALGIAWVLALRLALGDVSGPLPLGRFGRHPIWRSSSELVSTDPDNAMGAAPGRLLRRRSSPSQSLLAAAPAAGSGRAARRSSGRSSRRASTAPTLKSLRAKGVNAVVAARLSKSQRARVRAAKLVVVSPRSPDSARGAPQPRRRARVKPRGTRRSRSSTCIDFDSAAWGRRWPARRHVLARSRRRPTGSTAAALSTRTCV